MAGLLLALLPDFLPYWPAFYSSLASLSFCHTRLIGSPLPCHLGPVIKASWYIMFSLKAIPTLCILSLAMLIYQVLSCELWELKQNQKVVRAKSPLTMLRWKAHSSSCFWRTALLPPFLRLGCSALSSMWAFTINIMLAKWKICFWCLHLYELYPVKRINQKKVIYF